MSQRVFLLSPANTSGERARQLLSPRAKSDAAQLYRTEEGVPIAIAFAFMSALYFRGKITYAIHFGGVENTFVIAPGFGLVPPTWCITEERMKTLSRTPVDVRKRNYRKPLERGDVNCRARNPLVFAGESRKTDSGIVLQPNAIVAAYLSTTCRPSRALRLSCSA